MLEYENLDQEKRHEIIYSILKEQLKLHKKEI